MTFTIRAGEGMAESPQFEPDADRPDTLPTSAAMEMLEAAVERIGPVRVRHAGRSAFVHLRKSWTLHPIDSEMSFFRALTAVEEASTALILALKQQRYPGADRLNANDHIHKAAIWPIIEAIARGYSNKGIPLPRIAVSAKQRPRVRIDLDLGPYIGLDRSFWVHSPDPFHLVIRTDETGPFEIHRWERELAQVAGGSEDVFEHIRGAANLRNVVLYAGPQGVPSVRFEDNEILKRLEYVKWIMVATIGILQTKTIQYLVVQALETLLLTLNRFDGNFYSFPADGPPQERHLSIVQQPDGSVVTRVFR